MSHARQALFYPCYLDVCDSFALAIDSADWALRSQVLKQPTRSLSTLLLIPGTLELPVHALIATVNIVVSYRL